MMLIMRRNLTLRVWMSSLYGHCVAMIPHKSVCEICATVLNALICIPPPRPLKSAPPP